MALAPFSILHNAVHDSVYFRFCERLNVVTEISGIVVGFPLDIEKLRQGEPLLGRIQTRFLGQFPAAIWFDEYVTTMHLDRIAVFIRTKAKVWVSGFKNLADPARAPG